MTRPHASRIGFRHAVRGLAWAFDSQRNLRVEVAVGAAAFAATLWLDAPRTPIVLATGLVLVAELLNTAIEQLVDLVRPEHHPVAGRAKDVAAAAVVAAAATAVGVGLIVLGPPLLARLTRPVG